MARLLYVRICATPPRAENWSGHGRTGQTYSYSPVSYIFHLHIILLLLPKYVLKWYRWVESSYRIMFMIVRISASMSLSKHALFTSVMIHSFKWSTCLYRAQVLLLRLASHIPFSGVFKDNLHVCQPLIAFIFEKGYWFFAIFNTMIFGCLNNSRTHCTWPHWE